MKLYATTTSERGRKVEKGGNEYIETLYNLTRRDKAQFRVRVINDEQMGMIYFCVENSFFGSWRVTYEEKIYIDIIKA